MVDWIAGEALGLFGPELADVFVGCEAWSSRGFVDIYGLRA